MRNGLSVAGVIVVGLASTAGSSASGIEIPLPNLQATLHARVEPARIPAGRSIPVSLHLGGEIQTGDGSLPPALREVQMEGQRQVRLDVSRLPACGAGDLIGTAPPPERCAKAIVGGGHAEVVSTFPEAKPVEIVLDLEIYKASARGKPAKLVAYAYMPVIEPGPILIPVRIQKLRNGRYGWKAVASIPKFFEGHNSITKLDLTLQKRVMSAVCPGDGLQFKVRSTFADGTVIQGSSIQDCR